MQVISTAKLGEPRQADRPLLSVVVPCFNEEDVLNELVRRVGAAAGTVAANDFELVLIDDGSRDRTRSMIETLAAEHAWVRGIALSRNHGHQRALSAGLAHARGERVLALDADLQDPPELLPEMMARMDAGADVVYGQRRTRAGETLSKRLTASLFYRFMRAMTDVDIPVDTGDFRLMRRIVVDHLNAMPEDDRFVRGMVSWLGFRQEPILYDRAERHAGQTKYPFRRMLRLATDGITGFSTVPLRLAMLLAGVSALLSILLLSYVIVSWAAGGAVPGWSSVMVTVLVMSSVQLFTIGVLGEYVGRLYMQSKQRPKYIVERLISGKPEEQSTADSDADQPAR